MSDTATDVRVTGDVRTIRHVPRGTPEQLVTRATRRRHVDIVLGIAVPLGFATWWQVGATQGWIDRRVYPPPFEIVDAVIELVGERLPSDIWATTARVLWGYAIGTALGLFFGVVMGISRTVRAALEPSLNALYVVPKLALLPVFLSIFGLGDGAKVAVVAVTVFFFVWIGTMAAIAAVPSGYKEAAESFGVDGWQMFRHVHLPAALPQIFVSMRVAVGVAILVTIAAEFVVGRDGLGQLIFSSRTLFINSWMYAGIVTVAVLGVLMAAVVGAAGRYMTPWERAGNERLRRRWQPLPQEGRK